MSMRVRVSVPATSANLGPGFDCLALALGLRNEIELGSAPAGGSLQVEQHGEGADTLPRDERNLVLRAARAYWQAHAGTPPGTLQLRAQNNIPLNSGMGSSAAAIVAGLAAAQALSGAATDPHALLQLAHSLEGHPDNAAAALLGGLTLASAAGSAVRCARITLPAMQVALALPAVELATTQARAALPGMVPLADAAFNIGHTALVVQALQTADYALLGWAMQDKLHQPQRRLLIRGYDAAEQAALQAGASAVVLSGAGPSLAAFAAHNHMQIAAAMQAAFATAGVACRTFVLPVEDSGVTVTVLQSAAQ